MKNQIKKRMPMFTALACTIFALAGFAHAGAVGTSNWQKAPKSHKGTVELAVATEVGGVTLEPGSYEVKQVNSHSGPVVRFTRFTYNPYAQEGLSPYDWETVAEVKVSMQALDSPATRSELLLASNGEKALGLEIRGNSVEYLF